MWHSNAFSHVCVSVLFSGPIYKNLRKIPKFSLSSSQSLSKYILGYEVKIS